MISINPILCKLQIAWITIFLLFSFSLTIFSQTAMENELLKKARIAAYNGKEKLAQQLYEQLLENDNLNAQYNIEIGLLYYEGFLEKEKAIPYFEKALYDTSRNKMLTELYFYLASAYHFAGRYQDAINYYFEFKDHTSTGSNTAFELGMEVDRYIEMCYLGIKLTKENNKGISIINMGDLVNSIFPEYAPVFNEMDSMLVFTSRKTIHNKRYYKNNDEYYYYNFPTSEDIYATFKNRGRWVEPMKLDSSDKFMGKRINTKKNDRAISFSSNGERLFIQRKNNILETNMNDGEWSNPSKIKKSIKFKEQYFPTIYITPDEKTLLMSSFKPDGFGGADIYKAEKLQDGTWGELKNIGPMINTPYDEETPFLSTDGNTLYFASKGHTPIGGYDIFKSVFKDGQWSTPENLGVPINSPGDDIFFVTDKDEKDGFCASTRQGGFGYYDLYSFSLKCNNIPKTSIHGLILAGNNKNPVGAKIIVTDKKTGETIGTFIANDHDGKYTLPLPPEKNYHLEVVADNYLPSSEDIFIPKQCENYPLYQEIQVKRLKNKDNQAYAQQTHYRNAFFNIQQHVQDSFQLKELKRSESNLSVLSQAETHSSLIGKVKIYQQGAVQYSNLFLLNENNEIIQIAPTDNEGIFKFTNIQPERNYSILINYKDLNNNNVNSTPILSGNVYWNNIPMDDSIYPIQPAQLNIVLANLNTNRIVNITQTNEIGYFVLDFIPTKQEEITSLNQDGPFLYDLDQSNMYSLYSAYLNIIRKSNTDISYAEYTDITDIDITTIAPPIPFAKQEQYEVVNKVGIPQASPKPSAAEELIVFKNILFDFDKTYLKKLSKEELNSIYKYLSENKNIILDISGHADWIGPEQYNMGLSERRAREASTYILDKGIDKDRVTFTWSGESKPIAPNNLPNGKDNPEGRRQNRRCEFKMNTKQNNNNVVMNF